MSAREHSSANRAGVAARPEEEAPPTKYPWQERFDHGPYTLAYAVSQETVWARRSLNERLQQKHAQAALANLDELREWITGPEGQAHRAYLERLAGPTDVALDGSEP